jgi:nucleotide-binding universal stress UspA family protein
MNWNLVPKSRRGSSAPAPSLHIANRLKLRAFSGDLVEHAPFPRTSEFADGSVVECRRIRCVLTPLDGTPFAEHALPLALEIARRTGAALHLVCVHAPLASPYEPYEVQFHSNFNEWSKQRQKGYLASLLQRIAAVSAVAVTPVVREARKNAGLVIAAEAEDSADLIVMASHRRSLLGRWLNGSVAECLLRDTSVPTLVVRGSNTPPELNVAPPLERVLIPLAGAQTEAAVAATLPLTENKGAEVTLLHVARDAPRWGRLCKLGASLRRTCHKPATAADRTARWEQALRRRGCCVRTAQGLGAGARSVLWHSVAWRSDLIVLAADDYPDAQNVIAAVVRNARTPVLVAPVREGAALAPLAAASTLRRA